MSTISNYKMKAWELAYWYFANTSEYLESECNFYAKQFERYALENLNSGVSLEDLLSDFVADIKVSEEAEKEKEMSRHD